MRLAGDTGGGVSDGSHSGGNGGNGGDASGAVTVWEVVSLLGKLLGTVAALKAILYLLRVCLAMAWKSGGASHSELIHNLRSKCHPRRRGAAGAGPGRPAVVSAPPRPLEDFGAGLHQPPRTACARDRVPRDLSLIGDAGWEGRERARRGGRRGGGPRVPGSLGGARRRWRAVIRVRRPRGRGACTRGGEVSAWPGRRWAATEGAAPRPRPRRELSPPPSVFSPGGRCRGLIPARAGRGR